MTAEPIRPTQSWRNPETHFLKALDSDWYRALLVLQDSLSRATIAFWAERGARFGHLPLTTGSISSPMGLGSDSSPVAVEISGVKTYLADSMQFGLEYLCRLNAAGAYYVMPSFRGEPNDATHLGQFFHSEAEIPGGLDDVLTVAEQYLRRITRDIFDENADLLRAIAGPRLDHIEALLSSAAPFRRLTFDAAVELLGEDDRLIRVDPSDGWRTLTRAGEELLMRRSGDFVWVTHWDHLSVPFYQAFDSTGRSALNADLLFGPGEVIGAGERHATGAEATRALALHGVSTDPYSWYLAMKDLAPQPTAGFGMGVERYLMWLLSCTDIRDFQLLPRENGIDLVP